MTWANMHPMGFNLPRDGLQAAGPQQLSLGMAGVAGLETIPGHFANLRFHASTISKTTV